MTKLIAIIDKAPSRNDYSKYFDFKFELLHMSSIPITKLLKKDVDLDFEPDFYDLIILVGSEAAKEYAKVTSVISMAGQLVNEKYVCLPNPATLIFKPEGKPDFEKAVARIKDIATTGEQVKTVGNFGGISDSDEAYNYLLECYDSSAPFVAMDTEGTGLYPRDGFVLGMSITFRPHYGRYILLDCLEARHYILIQKIIDKYPIVFHNMKYDIKMLEYHTCLKFNRDNTHDTMVMHYVLDENSPHGLKILALKYTNYGNYDQPLEDFKAGYCKAYGIKKEDFTYDLIPFDIICEYASEDTAVTFLLAGKFLPIIEANEKLTYVYYNLMIRGTHFLNKMEEVGIPISLSRMQAADVYLKDKIDAAVAKLYEFKELKEFEALNGGIFNPNSVVQLRSLLFDYLGLPSGGKLTATGALSTDAEVLKQLAEIHPIPAAILDIRKLGKMRNTYVSKILPELDMDGRIRTNFNLIFTTSGRLSSSGKFNAQQIVRDDPIIKGCIYAPEGYSIVSQD